ncbi:hypothetical protein DOTSEDRAFT_170438 [Dothistroma septosporum NZE10]|uniref:AB hydrolase-1 domain-containing protein n=1 Tax=Dothistroma septosporum (strain NZE10 / CBS 128990) TaxID=675120 RepID=N1PS50_DOTSN|nr:hypothetical protein DOTSEDRAFT_170438 [Dothistroma septosporum NZE10]
MELPSTFDYAGWKIKYSLLEPSQCHTNEIGTIVFVHGTPWSAAIFQPLVEAIQAKRPSRILLYDLPGYGQSQSYTPPPNESRQQSLFSGDTSVSFQATALTALLRKLDLDGIDNRPAPAIIAHDIAGTIVLRSHLIHKCNFRSMLLMDTTAVLPWGDGFYKLARSQPEVFVQLPRGIFEAVVRAVARSASHEPRKLEVGWEDLIVEPWLKASDGDGLDAQQRQSNFVRQIAQANDQDVAEMLDQDLYGQVRCDVKILWGENDQWIPKEKMEQLSGMIGHSLQGFIVIPKAGHLLMIDQPERVGAEVVDWVLR